MFVKKLKLVSYFHLIKIYGDCQEPVGKVLFGKQLATGRVGLELLGEGQGRILDHISVSGYMRIYRYRKMSPNVWD